MLLAPLAAALTLLLAAAPLSAQQSEGGPIRLLPQPGESPPPLSESPAAPGTPAAPGAAPPVAPGMAPGPTPGPAPTTTPPRTVQGIEINPLGEIAPGALGTLTDAGGLGADLWQGSHRATVLRLLPKLPAPLASPAASELARRLLLTAATPPADGGDQGELLAARIERLAALGALADLRQLLATVPRSLESAAVARAEVEVALLDGDDDAACREVTNKLSLYSQELFWQKAAIYCQLRAGESDQARLGLDLLREQGGLADDPAFVGLVEAMAGQAGDGQSGEGASPERIDPLHLALLRAAGRGLPEDAVERASALVVTAIATTAAFDLEQRAAAAERSVTLGVLPAETLAEVYGAFPFAPDELARAISAGSSIDSPRGRALLYQAARGQTLPPARAEILSRALGEARSAGVYRSSVAVLTPLLAEVPVSGELLWIAEEAARAFYAVGSFERAAAWHALLRQGAAANTTVAEAERRLWPLARLAGDTGEDDFAGWYARLSGDRPAEPTLVLLAALSGLGQPALPLAGYAGWEAGARPVDSMALLALDAAVEGQRRGEALLLGLIALGPEVPAGSHPVALARVLAALPRLGLEQSARALAIEAALAAGW